MENFEYFDTLSYLVQHDNMILYFHYHVVLVSGMFRIVGTDMLFSSYNNVVEYVEENLNSMFSNVVLFDVDANSDADTDTDIYIELDFDIEFDDNNKIPEFLIEKPLHLS